MRVFINPNPLDTQHPVGGIYRVIEAQGRYLAQSGVEIVSAPEKAEVVAVHAGEVTDTDCPYVAHSHGMYWTGEMDWTDHYWYYNNPVIENLRRAHAITVPSEWVATPIKRDMRRIPFVIPHGIDVDDFSYTPDHGGYVLWGKPRVDVVSDPKPVNILARQCPKLDFRTTYGQATQNVHVIGTQPFDKFQELLSHAGLWLATTRETGDIASREAMAYGVPVVGWDWGATKDLVVHKETGWLSPVGNYNHLAEGVHWCLANRERLGRAAREEILENHSWEKIIPRYAAVYQDVLSKSSYPIDVSFVIPAYNYAKFLPECLNSILDGKWSFSYEVIVVNDCSTDDTADVLSHFDGIQVINHETNLGLSMALNSGHSVAKGKYISNLDADNILSPGFDDLYVQMERNPWVDIGTAPFRIMNTDRVHGAEPSVRNQLNHYNQIPSTCLIRSRSIKHLGGYRRRQVKNEDAEFWCRAMSAGVRAQYLSDSVCFEYRWHGENKSAIEGGEDEKEGPLSWNFYFPWRIHDDITPFAMLGHPPRGAWAVRAYESPHISVVIPCGPGHQKYLMDALDSVAAQTYNNIECVVANDTGEVLDVAAMGHPWVRVVNTLGKQGPAVARNTAIHAARAPLILPLDADDMLYPSIAERMYRAWISNPDCLVYADCDTEDKIGSRKLYHSGHWSWEKISREAIYQDTILFAKQWWEAVDGYPAEFSLWEDWLFGVKLHIAGVGATYLEGTPWGVYRHWTSLDSGASKSDGDNSDYGTDVFKERVARSREYIERKATEMACKSCGGNVKSNIVTQQDPLVQQAVAEGNELLLVWEDGSTGYHTINSKAFGGRKYRIRGGEPFRIPPEDAWMLRLANIRKVETIQAPTHADLPKQLPTIPEIRVDVPKPNVESSMPAAEEEIGDPLPEMDVYSEPVGALSAIPHSHPDRLAEAGFKTLADIRRDIVMNNGAGILAVQGIGETTLEKIEDFLMESQR